jgi:hypothetical protein
MNLNPAAKNFSLSRDLNLYFFFALIFACYQGFRAPSKWSVNYYIPGFFDGIYRRALLGTILTVFGDSRFNYYFIASIQICVFLAILGILISLAIKSNVNKKIFYILYLVAPTGSYLFHEIGYVEQLLYLLLLVSVLNRSLGLVIMLSSIMIHEIALFTTIPIYFVMQLYRSESLKKIAFELLIILIAFAIFYNFITVSSNVIEDFINLLQSKANYHVSGYYYELYKKDFTKNQIKCYYGAGQVYEIVLCIMFSFYIAKQFAIDRIGRNRTLIFCSVFLAVFSPVILGFLGLDVSRWIFLSFSSGIFLLSIYEKKLNTNITINLYFILIFFAVFGNFYLFEYFSLRTIDFNKGFLQFINNDLYQIITDPLSQP